ncbi:hypothetical protein [Sinobaca sp. H24]|uniref:hypothetical protein n=1 Tax=Sinobaca sp. H24 TaxID=2923376 RepID=UPI002079523E|nr:hypothetical protein [Sinobaca sp. H24]
MQAEINYFIGMLFLILTIWLGGLYGIHWLVKRWYIKRNGSFRVEKHASARHQRVSFWFAVLTFPLSAAAGFLPSSAGFVVIICLLAVILIWTVYNIYVWKKESNNPDDYRFELYNASGMGGYSLIVFIGFLTYFH